MVAAAVVIGLGASGVWLSERESIPCRSGSCSPTNYVVHGLQVGSGQWLLAAAIGLVVLAVAAVVLPARRRLLMAALLPVGVGAVALGYWLKSLSAVGDPVSAAVRLALVGIGLVAPAAGLAYGDLRRGVRLALVVILVGVVALLATTSLSTPSQTSPVYRVF